MAPRRSERNGRERIDGHWKAVNALAQTTVAIGAIEDLSALGRKTHREVLPWHVVKTRYRSFGRIPHIDKFFGPTMDRVVPAVQIAASVGLLFARNGSKLSTVLEAAQLVSLLRQYLRNGSYGRDGSDHAVLVEHAMLLTGSAFSKNESIKKGSFLFIGAQGAFSYLASGSVKATSPVWRHGVAFGDSLRTINYGEEKMFKFLTAHPGLRRLGAWSVIASESLFPLVLILPRPLARLASVGMLGMHAGIARFMGLNRFFWAFAAMHPAIEALGDESRSKLARLRANRRTRVAGSGQTS
jgi:hypothetical protein